MIDKQQMDRLKKHPELCAFLEATEGPCLCTLARQLQPEYVFEQQSMTPFELMAALGNLPQLNSLKVLSDHDDLINEYALYLAVAHGHLPVVQDLIQYYQLEATGDTSNHAILRFAVGTGQLGIVKYLLTKYPDTHQHLELLTRGPLFFAAAKNHKEIVAYFLNFPTIFAYAAERAWPFKNHVADFIKEKTHCLSRQDTRSPLMTPTLYTPQADDLHNKPLILQSNIEPIAHRNTIRS